MMEIALLPVANQGFTVNLDSGLYDLTLRECAGMMCADIALNGATVITGTRIVAGEPIINFPYLEAGGNFVLYTQNGDLPYYDQFGVTQTLFYLTDAEMGL